MSLNTDRSHPGSQGTYCPACGEQGRGVRPVTLQHLLDKAKLDRLVTLEGYRFCATPHCDVVYYHPESGQYLGQHDVLVPVWQKGTDPERLVCYCFQYTVAEIENEVTMTGTSPTCDAIMHRCQQGLSRCEVTNPQGSCCVGNVRQILRETQATQTSPPARQHRCLCCADKSDAAADVS
ncbi:MAG: putative iron-sulfur cluster-binding metallochaperone [Armatimonadota bacterium]